MKLMEVYIDDLKPFIDLENDIGILVMFMCGLFTASLVFCLFPEKTKKDDPSPAGRAGRVGGF